MLSRCTVNWTRLRSSLNCSAPALALFSSKFLQSSITVYSLLHHPKLFTYSLGLLIVMLTGWWCQHTGGYMRLALAQTTTGRCCQVLWIEGVHFQRAIGRSLATCSDFVEDPVAPFVNLNATLHVCV